MHVRRRCAVYLNLEADSSIELISADNSSALLDVWPFQPTSCSTPSAGCRSSNRRSWRSSWANPTRPSTARASHAAIWPQSSTRRSSMSGRGFPVGAFTPSRRNPLPYPMTGSSWSTMWASITSETTMKCNTISTTTPTQARSKTARRILPSSLGFPFIQLRISPRLYFAMYSDFPYSPPRAKAVRGRL